LIVFCSALKTGLGSRAFWTSSLKTSEPKMSLTRLLRKSIWLRSYSVVAMAWIAAWRRFDFGQSPVGSRLRATD
jgi:hypothetical protein